MLNFKFVMERKVPITSTYRCELVGGAYEREAALSHGPFILYQKYRRHIHTSTPVNVCIPPPANSLVDYCSTCLLRLLNCPVSWSLGAKSQTCESEGENASFGYLSPGIINLMEKSPVLRLVQRAAAPVHRRHRRHRREQCQKAAKRKRRLEPWQVTNSGKRRLRSLPPAPMIVVVIIVRWQE